MFNYAAYAIVNGRDTNFDVAQKQLCTEVEIMMTRGWQPQGGIIFLGLFNDGAYQRFVFSQALLKPAGETAQAATD